MLDTPRTTLVACIVQGTSATWVHCGDSRLYLVRAGELLTRTRDHSYLEQQSAVGAARTDRINRNILFTCLGSPNKPVFDITGPVTLQQGDKIMLCSDGLWSGLTDADIVRDLATKPVSDSVPDLVEAALRDGGEHSDNVTVIALEWETPDSFESTRGISTDSIMDGVFASTSLLRGEAWRWQTHLANVPFYYEFKDNTSYDNTVLAGLAADSIEFKYANNYKNIFDLYLNNSVTKKEMLGNVTVNDSMAEFALGRCAMVQNGNWGASQILGVDGNKVADKDIKFLPIYTGMPGEEKQGLCIGTENFLCINSQVSPEKQQASVDFLVWLYSSKTGKAFVKDQLGFIAPFNTFSDDEKPTDPLAKELLARMAKDGYENIQWTFAAFPSENFKNAFGDALLEYAQGTKTWDDVVKIVKDSWTSERAAANAAS
jgi:hypothetical protein